jgi:hypothetical protein
MKKTLLLAVLILSLGQCFSQVKISLLDTAATLTGSELIPVVQGGVTKRTAVDSIRIEKVYAAYMLQTSTDAPTVDVSRFNSIGTIVWSYEGVGDYHGTLIGAFPAIKTPTRTMWLSSLKMATVYRISDDVIGLSIITMSGGTPSFSDSWSGEIEIHVFK